MRLSIITINLNNKEGLQKTIDSIISQTYKDYEWIIIDGGSTDGSKELIEKYDKYVTYWISEPDKGIYNAMNKGIKIAKGEYLNFMNSGDTFYDSSVLDSVYKLTINTNSDIYYGNSLYIYETKERIFYRPQDITLLYLYKDTILHQSSFIKRELFNASGYDETLKIVSDWKMWLIWMLQDKKFYYLDLIISRFDAYGISTTNTILVSQEREKVIKDILPLSIRHSLDKLDQFNNIVKTHPILLEIYSYLQKRWIYTYLSQLNLKFFKIINLILKKR